MVKNVKGEKFIVDSAIRNVSEKLLAIQNCPVCDYSRFGHPL